MKKLFVIGFGLLSAGLFSQSIDFGLKAGMVYNTDNGVLNAVSTVYENNGSGSVGFQAGGMMRIKAVGFYVQPELLYTSFNYEHEINGDNAKHKFSRIDLPVNVGKTFGLGLVQIQTGPVFSINTNNSLDGLGSMERTDSDNISLGWQLGTGLNIKSLNFDLRYEFGLSRTASRFIQNSTGAEFQTRNRANLLNFTVGYFF